MKYFYIWYTETFGGFPLDHRSILTRTLLGNCIMFYMRQASTILIQLPTVPSKLPVLQTTPKPEVC